MDKQTYVAKTLYGLEELLSKEIISLGGTEVIILNRAVSFKGDLAALYKINLWSRTALRVIHPILHFKAHNETVFYKRLRRFDWSEILDLNQTLKINATVHSDRFRHSRFIALKTKDAIMDNFRDQHNGLRPSIDLDHPDVILDVYCKGTEFTISLDSSGKSLHKRGYRQKSRMAPLNEVLAAGLVLLSGWQGKKDLFDPMCGSGTIAMEAALIGCNIPPGIHRKHYGFMNWKNYDEELWLEISKESESLRSEMSATIYATDRDAEQVSDFKSIVGDMGLSDKIQISLNDFFESEPPAPTGILIVNPPYGLRLELEDAEVFYKSIGDNFKKKYDGWVAWVLSGNKQAIKRLGLRTSRKLTLVNGAIECKFHRYDLYKGSKTAVVKET